METKKCNTCGEIKSLEDYYKEVNVIYYEYQCKLCKNKRNKEYYLKNKKTHNERTIRWSNENKERHKKLIKRNYTVKSKGIDIPKIEFDNQYKETKRKRQTNNVISHTLRSRLYDALKNYKGKKYESVLKLLGCTIEEFKSYLEKQFLPEMNWDNHGVVWEIDHIKPCATFDLFKIEEQKQCFHFSNHQPLFKTTEIAENLGYNELIGNRNKNKF
jgi:hypothetical protein